MTPGREAAADRYWLSGDFGSRAAINSTSACRDCGAVVWDEAAHDRWHAESPPARKTSSDVPDA